MAIITADIQHVPHQVIERDALMFQPISNKNKSEKKSKKPPKEDISEIIMKYGTDPQHPALNKAMDESDYLAVKALIEYGTDINSRKSLVIWDAMSLHVDGYTSKRAPGKTVIETAIEIGNIELVKYFLSKNANPLNYRPIKHEAYCYLVQTRNRIETRERWESIINYTTTGVYDAISLGRLDILTLFIKHGVDLNAICYKETRDNENPIILTPLQAAIRLKQKDIVSFLLSNGVKI